MRSGSGLGPACFRINVSGEFAGITKLVQKMIAAMGAGPEKSGLPQGHACGAKIDIHVKAHRPGECEGQEEIEFIRFVGASHAAG